ncbi:hypothetical protein AAE478_007212 [Parahypoxylon ruwenzoriense]
MTISPPLLNSCIFYPLPNHNSRPWALLTHPHPHLRMPLTKRLEYSTAQHRRRELEPNAPRANPSRNLSMRSLDKALVHPQVGLRFSVVLRYDLKGVFGDERAAAEVEDLGAGQRCDGGRA